MHILLQLIFIIQHLFELWIWKEEKDYTKIFEKIHSNIKHYLNIGEEYIVEEIHTDFEYAISNACRKIYPNVKSKFYIFHLLEFLDINKNKLCLNVNENGNLFILHNTISCHPDYVKAIFELVIRENDNINFKLFLEYFEKQYIKKYR